MTIRRKVCSGMTSGKAQKIAVSVPRAVFDDLEKKRRELKRSRSALVTDALRQFLARGALSDEELRYVRAYLEHPEDGREALAIAKASSWGDWDEEK